MVVVSPMVSHYGLLKRDPTRSHPDVSLRTFPETLLGSLVFDPVQSIQDSSHLVQSMASSIEAAVGQHQWYHFGVGAPPILVQFGGDSEVRWGRGVLTPSQVTCDFVALGVSRGPQRGGYTDFFRRELITGGPAPRLLRTHGSLLCVAWNPRIDARTPPEQARSNETPRCTRKLRSEGQVVMCPGTMMATFVRMLQGPGPGVSGNELKKEGPTPCILMPPPPSKRPDVFCHGLSGILSRPGVFDPFCFGVTQVSGSVGL